MNDMLVSSSPGVDDRIIPADMFKLMARVLLENGHRSDQLIKGTGLDLSELMEEKNTIFVSFHQITDIIDNCLEICGDPGFGLAFGLRDFNSNFHPVNYATVSCQCPEQALEIASRYRRISTFLTHDDIIKTEEKLFYCSTPLHRADRQEPFIIETAFSILVDHPRRIFQDDKIHPNAIHLRYPDPGYRERYEALFRCPVHFNCANNRIIWDIEDIKVPYPTHNPAAVEMALQLCERLMGQQPGNDLTSKIRLRLMKSPGRFPSMEIVAEEFGTSVRTLRRALKEDGTTFQNIYNEVRRKIATEYLENSVLSIEDISELVGFGSAGNFHRAFKKWTGKPPTEIRRQASRH
jgi:AraC-like DNA-binding protein